MAEDVLSTIIRFDETKSLLVPSESNTGRLAIATAATTATTAAFVMVTLTLVTTAPTVIVAPAIVLVPRHLVLSVLPAGAT